MKIHPLIPVVISLAALGVSTLSFFKASENLSNQRAGQRPRIDVIEESLTDVNSGKLELIFAFKNVGSQSAKDVVVRLIGLENETSVPGFDDRIEAVNPVHPGATKIANIPINEVNKMKHILACVSYAGQEGKFSDVYAYSHDARVTALSKFGVYANMRKEMLDRLQDRKLCG